MREELLKLLGPREERIHIGGLPVIVKTMPDDADATAFKGAAKEDFLWLFATRCTFYEDGTPAFTDDDIPVLKAAPRITIWRLVQAVEDVNGFNQHLEVKNSAAGPSSG